MCYFKNFIILVPFISTSGKHMQTNNRNTILFFLNQSFVPFDFSDKVLTGQYGKHLIMYNNQQFYISKIYAKLYFFFPSQCIFSQNFLAKF